MFVDEPLETALMRTGRNQRQIPVVDETGRLAGMVDLDTMISRGEIARSRTAVDMRL